MSEKELVLYQDRSINLQLWSDICYDLAENEDQKIPTLKYIQENFDLKKKEALQIIAHPKFADFFHRMQKAIAKLEFNRHAFHRLNKIVRKGSDANAVRAVKALNKMLGYQEDSPMIGININIEKEINEIEKEEAIDVEATEYPGL